MVKSYRSGGGVGGGVGGVADNEGSLCLEVREWVR